MINIKLHDIFEFADLHYHLFHDFCVNSSILVRNDLAQHGIDRDVTFYLSPQHLFVVTSNGKIAVIS
jgi:hypothetical protein